MTDTIIIGGGAAGMAAAIAAAEAGGRVTLIERQSRVGRKLLATGNGRCNLSNRAAGDGTHYHGEQPGFSRAALARYGVEDTLAWFRALGLITVEEPDGKLYPYSNMAGSVLDVLRFALERPGITVRCGERVTALRRERGGFAVETETDRLRAGRVILAAGGCAGAKLGGVTDGYQLAAALGHSRTALHPALVQIKTDPTYPRALKGVKADAAVHLLRGRECLAETRGEILFTEYGVSGPAIFELSRAAATGGEGLRLSLDLLSGWTEAETAAWLRARRRAGLSETAQLLTGTLHTRLGQTVCRAAGFTNQPPETLTDGDLDRIARSLRGFSLPVTGVCGFDQAQVTAGGLRTAEFDAETLESRLVPGLFAVGEVLDVDGDCGGFNLQWAWSSGRAAGGAL